MFGKIEGGLSRQYVANMLPIAQGNKFQILSLLTSRHDCWAARFTLLWFQDIPYEKKNNSGQKQESRKWRKLQKRKHGMGHARDHRHWSGDISQPCQYWTSSFDLDLMRSTNFHWHTVRRIFILLKRNLQAAWSWFSIFNYVEAVFQHVFINILGIWSSSSIQYKSDLRHLNLLQVRNF